MKKSDLRSLLPQRGRKGQPAALFRRDPGQNKRRHTGKALVLSAMLAASVLLSACAPFSTELQRLSESSHTSQEDDVLPPEEETENLITVGFSQLGSESLWRNANTTSIEQSLSRENGFFLLSNNARQKQENQIKAIRSYISQGVDCIVFAPVTESGWRTVLMEAKEAGIPVIAVDRRVELSSRYLLTSWIGEDMRVEGENAGKWLEDYLKQERRSGEVINIVVLQGTNGSSAQIGRTIGFDSIADKHPNWNILEQRDADFTIAKGREVMETFLKKYQDIDVVVSQNDDMTFGAVQALQEAGLQTGEDGITLISFDGTRQALEMVRDGIINVDLECNPLSGPLLSDIIRRIRSGEPIKDEYYMDEKIFTRENVDKFISNRLY